MMTIKDWPIAERPRERLLAAGPHSLSDAELLAIFLRTGVSGKSAVELARDLLARFGSLRRLLAADQATFCLAPGLGTAKFAQLQAVLEMARRHLDEQFERGSPLLSPEHTAAYLKTRLRDYPYEVFAVLFLDNRHRVIAFDEMFRGTIDGASVHPREVVRRALQHNAAAVILSQKRIISKQMLYQSTTSPLNQRVEYISTHRAMTVNQWVTVDPGVSMRG